MEYRVQIRAQERIRRLMEEVRIRAEEIRALCGDAVWDFNDVWGGAGPDCVVGLGLA